MSRRELAEKVTAEGYPVSHTAVGNYENEGGTERIPAGYLAAICRLFGVSPNWLLLDIGPPRLEQAGEAYRLGRSDLAGEIVERLLPDLVPGTGARGGGSGWEGALAILRRRLGDVGEEGTG